jgi:hypothetical protein
VQAAISSIEFHTVQGAGHESVIEAPEAVNPLLIIFLKKITIWYFPFGFKEELP